MEQGNGNWQAKPQMAEDVSPMPANTSATPCGKSCASCSRRIVCPALVVLSMAHEGGRA